MKTVIKLLIILFLITTSCTNKKAEREQIGKPEIIHLQDTYYSKFYLFEGFRENEKCIRYLFNFINKENGHLDIVTDRNSVKFEDGYSIDDFSTVRFAFSREKESLRNNYIRVNFLKEEKLSFRKQINKDVILISGDFESLNLNILQNMLDYAKEDENKNKKKNKSFTYELYNKDNIKKVVIVYHNYGEWFSIDIL